jgi:transporter family protein
MAFWALLSALFAALTAIFAKVALVDKLSLVLVAVVAFAFLGERPTLREWLGIIMVAGGVVILSLKRQ